MELLLLGLAFGVVTVMMPGPINLSLLQVASVQGRSAGSRAGIGIAGGDVILAVAAVTLVSGGAAFAGGLFSFLQALSALVLVAMGLALLLRPGGVQAHAGSVTKPGRTFLLLTALMPSALGSWLAILAAMPFAHDRPSLIAFAAGIVASSVLWHPALGFGVGTLGERLTPKVLATITRLGGLATLATGLWALL